MELVLKGKDERIEEPEKSVDKLQKENEECYNELGEVSAVNAKDAVYAQHHLGMAMSQLRAVDEDRFQKFKQGLTESYEIQSLQARLGEAQDEGQRKSDHLTKINSINSSAMPAYSGVYYLTSLRSCKATRPHLRCGVSRICMRL